MIETGEDGIPAVVYFERELGSDSLIPDDFLRVVDLTTGEPLEITLPEFDPEEFTFEPLGLTESGDVFLNTYTPAYPCLDGQYCWLTTFAESEDGSGYGVVVLDPVTLEATYDEPYIAETEDSLTTEWGFDYGRISNDSFEVARYRDAEVLWRATVEELFDVERTSPPDFVDFTQVGDLVLIQGYQPLLETLDADLPHTLSIDFTESRTLIAVDAETGDVAWRLPGGDMLCHAVHERPIATDAETIPICLASDGGFSFNFETEQMDEQTDLVASIAELDIATGEVGWEVAGAGVVSIAHTARLLDLTYAARGDLAVVDDQDAELTQLVDLRDGATYPMPEEDAFYVCKAERADVELDFEGSAFASGSNPITTGYPGGWYHFPCDDEGTEADVWTKGAVRVAGYPAGDGRVILPLDGALVAFDL